MKLVIFIFFIFIRYQISAQNLILNGNFEDHDNVSCLTCYDPITYSAVLKGWTYTDWLSPYICNKKYGIYDQGLCNFKKYTSFKGNTHIELIRDDGDYFENGNKNNCQYEGYANYLETKIAKSLDSGKVYRIESAFFVISSMSAPYVANYSKRIGIDLAKQPFQKRVVNGNIYACTRRSSTPFVLDTIFTDKWQKKIWYVMPSTTLKYLQIGVFLELNDRWEFGSTRTNGRYGVDDVSISEVTDSTELSKAKIIYYPQIGFQKEASLEQVEKQKLKENLTLYYDSNASTLTESHIQNLHLLDTTLLNPEKEFVIDIIGHTDSVGNNKTNETLAFKRATPIMDYLQKKGIPYYLINLKSEGAEDPKSDNNSEEGRKANRRVEVKPSKYKPAEQYYFHATRCALSKQTDSVFFFINKWLNTVTFNNYTLIFFDTDLQNLQKDKRWDSISQEIKLKYNRFEKPKLAFWLDSLSNADQIFRTPIFVYEKKINTKRLDTLSENAGNKLRDIFDKSNLVALKKLINRYGWPKMSEVGQKAAYGAFLIINHSDTKTMKAYLPILESHCKINEATWEWYAMMFDRIRIDEKQPQRYGTQYIQDGASPKSFILAPIEEPDKVDVYRKQVGLGSIENIPKRFKFK
jgi:outer membrane protein OmpA-like peptidoglycan-associated protein